MSLVRMFPVLVIGMLIVAACGGQPAAEMADDASTATVAAATIDEDMAESDMDDAEAMDDEMSEGDEAHADETDADAMDSDVASDGEAGMEVADEPMAEAVARPAWQQIALTNARTGELFTLADYADKTVFVEPFATWCGNCRKQLGNVQSAHAALGEDVVFVALSVEPNIGNEALVDYADKAGFEYVFAAMPQEMLQELAALYGQTIANPPATPHFIIRRDGSTTDLVTGIEGSEALIEQIQAASG